jgi:DNA transposition AAA+ family ATPase
LSELCGAVRAYTPDTSRTYVLYKSYMRELRRRQEPSALHRDAPGLFVLDEANHLSDAGMDVVRDIYDESEIGLVLLGNVELQIRLKRGANRWTSGHLPLLGRMTCRMDLEEVTPEDLAAFADHHGLDGPARNFLATVARRGGLRTVNAVLRNARALNGDGDPRLADLREAAAMVGTLGREG